MLHVGMIWPWTYIQLAAGVVPVTQLAIWQGKEDSSAGSLSWRRSETWIWISMWMRMVTQAPRACCMWHAKPYSMGTRAEWCAGTAGECKLPHGHEHVCRHSHSCVWLSSTKPNSMVFVKTLLHIHLYPPNAMHFASNSVDLYGTIQRSLLSLGQLMVKMPKRLLLRSAIMMIPKLPVHIYGLIFTRLQNPDEALRFWVKLYQILDGMPLEIFQGRTCDILLYTSLILLYTPHILLYTLHILLYTR